MRRAVIVDMVRTPFCRADEEKGWLSKFRSDDLAVTLIKELIRRHHVDPKQVDEVIIGCANPRGIQASPARNITLLSGLPFEVASLSMERACISSMSSVHTAAMSILCGMGDIYFAGGIESMTRFRIAKFSSDKPPTPEEYERQTGRVMNPRLPEIVDLRAMGMGMTAEKMSQVFQVPRLEQDKWGLRSNVLADRAYRAGKFKEEIIPIEIEEQGQKKIIDRDQEIRPDSTLGKISTLPTPFNPTGGSVNAANSSKESDGAAVALLMSEQKAKELGLKPLAYINYLATTGVDPTIMGYGATIAAKKVLQKSGMPASDIGLWEINEAFAVVVLVAIRELGIKNAEECVNVNGGACAIGHPVGASGARITGTLAREMVRRNIKYGLASICGGMGQGGALILEKY